MTYPIDAVRTAFPSLAICDAGKPRIYLDNPAGTQVPARVAEATARALIETNANLGGYFVTSRAAEKLVEDARSAMAAFLNARSAHEIVIAQSMTNLTFNLARSLGRTLRAGDEIVVTRMDHDGNIAPWLSLAEDRDLVVRWVDFDHDTWVIEPDALAAVLSDRTKIVALNYASNLTGSINDVARLTALAKQHGALVYVDGVQFAPHGLTDVQAIGCDFYACSSYKFYGPHLGIVWGREELLESLYAYKVRPQPNQTPWKFETGTPQVELIAALGATIDHFTWLGESSGATGDARNRISGAFAASKAWERELTERLVCGLKRIPGTTIHGITAKECFDRRVPTVSFTHARPLALANCGGARRSKYLCMVGEQLCARTGAFSRAGRR